MKKFLIVIIFFSCSCLVHSQSNWFWQNPLPQGNRLYGINHIDENNFMCISSNSLIKTIDGGENWNVSNTGFANVNNSLSMVDQNTGYMFLRPNIIIKTTNAGTNWNFICEVDTSKYPISIKFISNETGFLFYRNSRTSYHGIRISRTSNGGVSWNIVMDFPDLEVYNFYFPTLSTGFAAGSQYPGTGSLYKLKFFKTTDGGIKWDSIPNSINLSPYALYFIDENTGYTGGGGTTPIYNTTNAGVN